MSEVLGNGGWRNRVQELRYLRPTELVDHPLQWRSHPAHQERALRGILDAIGIAGVGLAYVSPATGQLTSIDGHLRKSLEDVPWPTVILDVTDDEAALLLAVFDPLSTLAETNRTALALLHAHVATEEAALQELLSDLRHAHTLDGPPPSLEHLATQYEPPAEEQFWPVIELAVPPDTHAQYLRLMGAQSGATEAARFAALLECIEEVRG